MGNAIDAGHVNTFAGLLYIRLWEAFSVYNRKWQNFKFAVSCSFFEYMDREITIFAKKQEKGRQVN